MILMNVSEFDNVADATDSMISAIQAFKSDSMDVGAFSMEIIDVFNQIGNSYAISTSDLADSLTRSSASLVAANNSLEQAVALTTAANTTIQNPETVGTTLKTLSMRIRGVKSELEEAGEDTEGMITNTSKLQAKVEALTNVDGSGGVNILANSKEFKSTYDILLEISRVWDKMSDVDQAALLEIIAGKRAGSAVAGILQNGDILEDAYKDALGADGSAMQELNTYLDSIQGKLDQLNNSTQTMWMNFMNSEVVKFFIDIANAIVKATDGVGLLSVAISAFAAKTAFNADSFGQFFELDINKATQKIERFGLSARGAGKNLKGLGIGAKAAAVGTQLLNSAISMGISLIASWLIGEVISAISEAANRMDELRDAALDSAEKTRESQESLEDYKKEIVDLRKKLDSNTLSEQEAYDAREQLIDIQNQLIDKFGAEAKGINLVTGEIEKQKEALDNLAKSKASEWLDTNVESYADAKKVMAKEHNSTRGLLLWHNGATSGLYKSDEQDVEEYRNGLRAIIEDKYGAKLEQTATGATDPISGNQIISFTDYLSFKNMTIEEISALLDDMAQFMSDFEFDKGIDLTNERARLQNFKAKYVTDDYIKNRDLYNQGRQQEAISRYAFEYGEILDAQEEFYNANTDEARLKALQNMNEKIKAAQDSHENDEHMDEWFGAIADDFDDLEFELKVKLDKDGLKTDLTSLVTDSGLLELDNTQIGNMIDLGLNKEGAVSENGAYTQDQINGLVQLQSQADAAGISLESLIDILVDLGIIAGRPVDLNTASVLTAVHAYSGLVDSINAYNEALIATEELTVDGAQANEDYYNSLISLGIAEADLAECIDKSNGYIVTNAKELNRLVKASKNHIAQNAKLAKAQAKLDYLELYKEMRQLTKGRNIENKAMLSHINSLYEQMTALDKTIAKYSILEAQLLGASNAYDQLESAQSADEAMDYGSKAEELVNVLANAFNTSELGTQAAQVAIAGLIPDDVIDKSKTLDEQMAQIYKYFTKGKVSQLFTIEFDDDGGITGVEMTKENVEKFTKQLIKDGKVFHGTWDEFTLDEGMTSLEQFADAIGVTKEVAFAYLTELEKYDINWLGGDYDTLLDQLMSGDLEYAINKNIQDLAELEHKVANGLITEEEYQKQYADLHKQYIENQAKAREEITNWSNTTKQIEDAQATVDRLKSELQQLQEDPNASEQEIALKQTELTTALSTLYNVSAALKGLEEPTAIVLEIASEDVEDEIAKIEKQLNEEGIALDTVVRLNSETGTYELIENTNLSTNVDLSKYVGLLNEQQAINKLLETGVVDTNTYLSNIDATISNIYSLLAGNGNGELSDDESARKLAIAYISKYEEVEGGADKSDLSVDELTGWITAYKNESGKDALTEADLKNLTGTFIAYKTATGKDALTEADKKTLIGSIIAYKNASDKDALTEADQKTLVGAIMSYTDKTATLPDDAAINTLVGTITSYKDKTGRLPDDAAINTIVATITEYKDKTGKLPDDAVINTLVGTITEYEDKAGKLPDDATINTLVGAITSYEDKVGKLPDDATINTIVGTIIGYKDNTGELPDDAAINTLIGTIIAYSDKAGRLPDDSVINTLIGTITEYKDQAGGLPDDSTINTLVGTIVQYSDKSGELPDDAAINALVGSIVRYEEHTDSLPDDAVINTLVGTIIKYKDKDRNETNPLSDLAIQNLVARIVKYVDDGAELPESFDIGHIDNVHDMPELETYIELLKLYGRQDPLLENDSTLEQYDNEQDRMKELESDPYYIPIDWYMEPDLEGALLSIEEIDQYMQLLNDAIENGNWDDLNLKTFGLNEDASIEDLKALLAQLQNDKSTLINITLDAAAQQAIDDFKANNAFDTELNVVIQKIDDKGFEELGLTRNEDGTWNGLAEITTGLNEEQTNKVIEYLNLLDVQHTLNVQPGDGIKLAELELEDVFDMLAKVYGLDIQANIDDSQVDSFIGWLKNTKISKTVSFAAQTIGGLWQKLFGSNGVNGTAHARGTAYKGGSWGAPKTETALTGELGPELRVRGNRWDLLGQNGAEFADIRKGDIIFNHKQTESLLSKGYVTGRGKAYAGGTAYAGINTWDDSFDNLSVDYGNKKGGKKGSGKNAADEFLEIFDWIEVRLEEINERLNLYSARLENTVGAVKQNSVIDKMIDLNQKLYDNLLAGADKYYAFAKTLLAKVPEEYRKAAQDGTIAIEAFVGEVDEQTLNAIKDYREWVQKGADATQQAEETLTEISNLAKQAIDNIAQEYENKASIPGAQLEQLEAYNSLLETDLGWESENIYKKMIEANNEQIGILKQQRQDMLSKLIEKVEAGEIKKYSQAWYDAVNDIAAVDTEIINLTTDTEGYQDSINELHFEKFDNLMSRLEAVSNEASNLIDILGNEDLVDKDTAEWTDAGVTSLGLYAQQMEVAEMQAQKYKEEINYLNKNWKKLGYTEREYVEKLEELKESQYDSIKLYNDTKKSIVDLTKERVDAIKKGIEKETEAYSELIEKKKEELSTEKDLHDFQKGVAAQQKEIADIERKLSALSADNSASARAKRAQLQSELLKAQAELEETYYDRSIEDQQNALDKELESFREEKEKEMEGWDEYVENTEKVVADGLATIQSNTEIVYNTLADLGKEYSLSMADAIISPWTQGEDAVQSFSDKFVLSMSATVEELTKLEKEFKQFMSEIEQAGTTSANKVKENISNYTGAEYQAPKAESNKESNSNTESKNNSSSSYTTYTVKGGDNLWKIAREQLGSESKWKEIYNLNQDIIKDPNLIRAGWKLKLPKYAKGTMGVKQDEFAWIDELGEELQLVPDGNGRLAYIKKGTAILNNTITERLMDLAMNPQEMLDRNRPSIGISPEVHNTEVNITMDISEVVHVEHVDSNNLPDLTKAVEKQLDKYMKNLNNQIRRYVR